MTNCIHYSCRSQHLNYCLITKKGGKRTASALIVFDGKLMLISSLVPAVENGNTLSAHHYVTLHKKWASHNDYLLQTGKLIHKDISSKYFAGASPEAHFSNGPKLDDAERLQFMGLIERARADILTRFKDELIVPI